MPEVVWFVAVLMLFLSLMLCGWVCHLANRIEDDRKALANMRGDVERGIDAASFAAADCRLASQQLRAAKGPTRMTPGERFRRLMDDDAAGGAVPR